MKGKMDLETMPSMALCFVCFIFRLFAWQQQLTYDEIQEKSEQKSELAGSKDGSSDRKRRKWPIIYLSSRAAMLYPQFCYVYVALVRMMHLEVCKFADLKLLSIFNFYTLCLTSLPRSATI